MNNSTITRTIARGIRLSAVAALLALLTGLLAVTQPARANPYVVMNTNNSGTGSLRQAITDANNHIGADTITFAAATDGIPIVLAGAAGEDANVSGDLDILDGGNLTIQGNGAANTIIDGGGIDRVFHIYPGGGCTNTVTLSGVTIRNGSVTGAGGGIYNAAGTTTVDGSTVSANKAGSYGGGIYNWAGTTTLNGNTVSANKAGFFGGGIYTQAGTTTVDGSTVSANTATFGGGIYNSAGTTKVTGSSVSANEAYDGGGIYTQAGTTTVSGSTVSANTATSYGGGIFNGDTLNVQNGSTIGGAGAGNTATTWGGGIYNHSNGTTTVTGSRILNNTATNGGGVLNNRDIAGATSVTSSCIVGNSAMSYFNNQNVKQIATGNWWGAATGPNTPGADTVGGNVHYAGWLTEPILGCSIVYLPLVLK